MTYTKLEQVEEYIKNVLFKSITFQLEEGHKISTTTEKVNGLYYVEKNMDKNNQTQIYHYMKVQKLVTFVMNSPKTN